MAKRLIEMTTDKFKGTKGSSFRAASTSNPEDWGDISGPVLGARRHDDHERAMLGRQEKSLKDKEKMIQQKKRSSENIQKELEKMTENNLTEAKKAFMPFKANKALVNTYSNRSTEDLRGMHNRWHGDHKDPKSDPDTSEQFLAVRKVLEGRGETLPSMPTHKNLGSFVTPKVNEETNTEKRMSMKNVARPDDENPTSPKSKLTKQSEIKNKITESPMLKSDNTFGIPKSLIEAAKSVMNTGKTQVNLEPKINDDENMKEQKGSKKELAALAHPKDKITKKDILVGRGVLAKEDTNVNEVKLPPRMTVAGLRDIVKKDRQVNVRDYGHTGGKNPKLDAEAVAAAKRALGPKGGKIVGMGESVEVVSELDKSTLGSYIKKASDDATLQSYMAAKTGDLDTASKASKRIRGIAKATDKLTKEDVDDDFAQMSRGTSRGKVIKTKTGEYIATNYKGSTKSFSDKSKATEHASSGMSESIKLTKEDVDALSEEQINEVLKKSDPASKWIKDFIDSDDPKFAGKTKKERMKMALGAYYAAQRNEEVELSNDEIERLNTIANKFD
jgi:hypothetical protein